MIDPDESSPEEFAEAIGRAIIAWQGVEMTSSQLFTWLLRTKTMGPIAMFYHIKSYSTRTELMDIAARFGLKKAEAKAQWASLRKRLIDLSALRNRIAHGDINETITATGFRLKLIPPITDFSRFVLGDSRPWLERREAKSVRYSELSKAESQFKELADDLDAFALTLMPRRTQRLIRALRRGELFPELGSDGLWRAELPRPPPQQRATTRQPAKKRPPQTPQQ